MQWRSPGQSRERGEKCECGEAGKGGRGTISLLVTDSSMQTTSPQGRNQEVGPLTQPEEEGGGGAEECKVWPYEQDLWVRGGGGCLQDRLDKQISTPQLDWVKMSL